MKTLAMRAAVDKTGPNANDSMHCNCGITLEYQGYILDIAGSRIVGESWGIGLKRAPFKIQSYKSLVTHTLIL